MGQMLLISHPALSWMPLIDGKWNLWIELCTPLFHLGWLMKARVTVMPKKSVLDPQGVAVRDAISHHGFPQIQSVRIGKVMEIEIDDAGPQAEARLHEICTDLLSNPVIEDYVLQIEG